MTLIPSWARDGLTLFSIAAAVVGWSLVLLQDRWLDNLEAKLAELREQPAASLDEPPPAPDSAAAAGGQSPAASAPVSAQVLEKLDELKSELRASWAEREDLNQIIHQSETEIKQLRAKLSQAAEAPSEAAQEFRTVTRTRMRAGPTTDAKEIGVISQGASVQVVDTVEEGTWYEVCVLGYAFHELLESLPKE